MKANIGGLVGFSTVDYPGHPSAVLFFAGCTLRCPFCQNPNLVELDSGKLIELEVVKNKILENKKMIDALVVTGGEPLCQIDALLEIAKWAKQQKLRVKIDTNGSFPERLKAALPYLDYVAMDAKTRLEPEKYGKATGTKDGKKAIENLTKSIEIVKKSKIPLEIRTTVVQGLVDESDVQDICKKLKPEIYVLQQFRPDKTLDPEYMKLPQTLDKTLENLAKIAKNSGAGQVLVRGSEIKRLY